MVSGLNVFHTTHKHKKCEVKRRHYPSEEDRTTSPGNKFTNRQLFLISQLLKTVYSNSLDTTLLECGMKKILHTLMVIGRPTFPLQNFRKFYESKRQNTSRRAKRIFFVAKLKLTFFFWSVNKNWHEYYGRRKCHNNRPKTYNKVYFV